MNKVRGRVWKVGDDINTDMIVAGKYLAGGIADALPHVLATANPEFARRVQAGDILVGGRNFGCGSSREAAPGVFKALGVGVVIAESFARIFFRNSVAIGMPVLSCAGIGQDLKEGDFLEVDIEQAWIANTRTGKALRGQPLTEEMLTIIKKGGVAALLKEEFGQGKA